MLVVIVLLRTIWDFKEFDLIYLLTGGGPVNSTQTLPLLVYQQAFGLNAMGRASTYAVGMMLVMLVFMMLYLYRARRGGALKHETVRAPGSACSSASSSGRSCSS